MASGIRAPPHISTTHTLEPSKPTATWTHSHFYASTLRFLRRREQDFYHFQHSHEFTLVYGTVTPPLLDPNGVPTSLAATSASAADDDAVAVASGQIPITEKNTE